MRDVTEVLDEKKCNPRAVVSRGLDILVDESVSPILVHEITQEIMRTRKNIKVIVRCEAEGGGYTYLSAK